MIFTTAERKQQLSGNSMFDISMRTDSLVAKVQTVVNWKTDVIRAADKR